MNQSNLTRTAMQFGAYTGLSKFALFLILYFVTTSPLGNKGMIGIVFTVIFVAIGTKFHRDHDLGGYISYWRGVMCGLMIAAFGAAIHGLLIYLFGMLADPQILENYKAESIAGIEEARQYLSNETMLAKLDEAVEKIGLITMSELALTVFYNGLIGGLLVSLIVAAIVRRTKPFFDEPTAPAGGQD
jgi:hypothetical protein